MLPRIISSSVPGPRSRALAIELKRFESPNVTYVDAAWPIFWERANGVNVWDADGNRYLDMTSAFGVAGLGHAWEPGIEHAAAQMRVLPHAMGDVHPGVTKVRLLRLLSEATFQRWGCGSARTILCNSGFEAVEAAMKTSMLYSGLPHVLAFTNSYHGLGFGALAATGMPYFSKPFKDQLPQCVSFVPYPACHACPWGERGGFRMEGGEFPNCSTRCMARLEEEIEEKLKRKHIGCILAEPIQARAGEVVPPRDFLRLLRAICDRHKILLVLDEIYTGWNRTGKLFACEHSNVVPDIIIVGKALSGFFPLSACVGRSDIMSAWPESNGEALHTSTFLGNPVGCAAAIVAIEEHMKAETTTKVKSAGVFLGEALKGIKSPRIGGIRSAGLLAGLDIIQPGDREQPPDPDGARKIVNRSLQDGLILLAGGAEGNTLSFSPPFGISREEISWAAERLQEYLTSL